MVTSGILRNQNYPSLDLNQVIIKICHILQKYKRKVWNLSHLLKLAWDIMEE